VEPRNKGCHREGRDDPRKRPEDDEVSIKEFLKPTIAKSILFFVLSALFVSFVLGQQEFAFKILLVSTIPFMLLFQGIYRSTKHSTERLEKAAETSSIEIISAL
jgi:hypothetical protein